MAWKISGIIFHRTAVLVWKTQSIPWKAGLGLIKICAWVLWESPICSSQEKKRPLNSSSLGIIPTGSNPGMRIPPGMKGRKQKRITTLPGIKMHGRPAQTFSAVCRNWKRRAGCLPKRYMRARFRKQWLKRCAPTLRLCAVRPASELPTARSSLMRAPMKEREAARAPALMFGTTHRQWHGCFQNWNAAPGG